MLDESVLISYRVPIAEKVGLTEFVSLNYTKNGGSVE